MYVLTKIKFRRYFSFVYMFLDSLKANSNWLFLRVSYINIWSLNRVIIIIIIT